MASETVAVPDRRQRRRQESIEEILDIAVEIMSEHGAGGLSLGEVARRMGIRPPSLYVYFASKDALYDALFERGAREIARVVIDDTTRLLDNLGPDSRLEDVMLGAARTFVRWTLEHPAYTQLLYWRPVPGFQPSAESFAPAVEMWESSRHRFLELQERGVLRADADVDNVQHDWASILTGVVTRQLANAPNESFDEGRFTARLGDLVTMFARYYATEATSTPSKRRARHADRR
jgi:AcrR family transcriptional regulator